MRRAACRRSLQREMPLDEGDEQRGSGSDNDAVGRLKDALGEAEGA